MEQGALALGRKQSPRSRRRSEGGFTLVEILVVITIIGLIMALVGPRVLNYLSESKVFYLDAGRYPSSAEGLGALVQPIGGVASWNGPYLKGGSVPLDPWGKAYVYRSPGEHGAYDVVSLGSDGQEGGSGTAADIASWSP